MTRAERLLRLQPLYAEYLNSSPRINRPANCVTEYVLQDHKNDSIETPAHFPVGETISSHKIANRHTQKGRKKELKSFQSNEKRLDCASRNRFEEYITGKATRISTMLNRIEIMHPSTSDGDDRRLLLLRPNSISERPIRPKRTIDETGKRKEISDTSTSATIRDETMELLRIPPRKRLRRAQKIYPPKSKAKEEEDLLNPWWNQIQIGDEPSGSFSTWQEMNNRSTGLDELDRENEAFSSRTNSISTISSEASDITF